MMETEIDLRNVINTQIKAERGLRKILTNTEHKSMVMKLYIEKAQEKLGEQCECCCEDDVCRFCEIINFLAKGLVEAEKEMNK